SATVLQFFGEKDMDYHSKCFVRVSEPFEVHFAPLAREEVVHGALATLDARERELRLQLEKKLVALRELRGRLLALTHASAA
ncbi:MAG: hypothetical protein ACREUG_11650, partial [Steroidobacteraceae bacterium]